MGFNDSIHLDVCREIEISLLKEYQLHHDLSDNLCVFGLEKAKIAIKKKQTISLKEHIKRIKNKKISQKTFTTWN